MMTSSTSAGSRPARSTAARTTWPPMAVASVSLNAPRKDLPMPVRAVATMTASLMTDPRRMKGWSSGALAGAGDDLAGEVAGVIRRQKHHDVRHFPDLCTAAEGLSGLQLPQQLLRCRLLQEGGAGRRRAPPFVRNHEPP